ncbi:hypothetical protein [Flagellimonas marina]|uniref:Uncharacterized protein n=1 Tax=Flagellimonas marina TaxID=1775168 RepID=A0ABV8PJQ1_9FLAO
MSEELEKLLYEVVVYGIGYAKVTNYGGKWAIVEDGIYRVDDRFGSKYPKKTKSQVLDIFKRLVSRYQNLEINGKSWTYSQGEWKVKNCQ